MPMIKEVHIINDDIVYEDLESLIYNSSSNLTKLDKEWLSGLYIQEIIRRKLYLQTQNYKNNVIYVNNTPEISVKASYYTDINLIHDFDNLIRWVEHIRKIADTEYKNLYRTNFKQAIKNARRFNKTLSFAV